MSLCETAGKNGHWGHFFFFFNTHCFTIYARDRCKLWLNGLVAGPFILALQTTGELLKPLDVLRWLWWYYIKLRVLLMHRGAGGEKEKLVLCFMSYFSSSPFPRVSLVVPHISDHQSWLYYYFCTKCFDFQPTQEIKSPPLSQCWNPLFPHLFIHSSFLSSSSLSLKLHFFCRACFKMSSFALVSSHPSHPYFHPHPSAPHEACFCILSVLAVAVPVLVHCDAGSKGVKGQLSRDTPLILAHASAVQAKGVEFTHRQLFSFGGLLCALISFPHQKLK